MKGNGCDVGRGGVAVAEDAREMPDGLILRSPGGFGVFDADASRAFGIVERPFVVGFGGKP